MASNNAPEPTAMLSVHGGLGALASLASRPVIAAELEEEFPVVAAIG